MIKLHRPTELLLWIPWSIHRSSKSKISRTHWRIKSVLRLTWFLFLNQWARQAENLVPHFRSLPTKLRTLTFADSLFLDSLNRGTAPMVKHNAQKQKCFKKRDFFNYFFANRWNIQLKVKEKTWEYLSDWLRFGWKCKELENNGDFVVLWPCLQMSQCRRKVCVNDKKNPLFSFL